jgi:leucyl aminopeptidase
VLGVDRDGLAAAGFDGDVGQALALPGIGQPMVVAFGIGDPAHLDAAKLRDAAAAFSSVVRRHSKLAAALSGTGQLAPDVAAAGIAELAAALGPERGLGVQVFDEDALAKLGCGGLLGVNRGSAEPPRMVKLTYTPRTPAGAPAEPSGRLTLVGKGVMYDSGGISLKPSDAIHATMKTDMAGAGAVLAAMSALGALDCPAAVTAYLMCAENMPSSTALRMGDVLTIHGGTTVEVLNTDEEGTDAIIDIATLTGACMRALGTEVAGVFGNRQPLVDQLLAAASKTEEPLWQLPLDQRYRRQLDSEVADLRNMGPGPPVEPGAITAAEPILAGF